MYKRQITNNKTGLLYPPDDRDALVNAIKLISNNRQEANNLGHNGKQHVISHFRAEQTAGCITKVYEALIAA